MYPDGVESHCRRDLQFGKVVTMPELTTEQEKAYETWGESELTEVCCDDCQTTCGDLYCFNYDTRCDECWKEWWLEHEWKPPEAPYDPLGEVTADIDGQTLLMEAP